MNIEEVLVWVGTILPVLIMGVILYRRWAEWLEPARSLHRIRARAVADDQEIGLGTNRVRAADIARAAPRTAHGPVPTIIITPPTPPLPGQRDA
ncbi:hypothetical protein QBC42DRAFT_291498 [Cladorrhinum samala]|uniref:Uncharacterized protein n=1 Tax=Cladorrhinum samala TaxID=585594 RepID=A0AAV9H9R6_9PEZI|nr:hypothetical protein QBC42DRAFT_291498 [Cladorrhinum samala]